MSNADLEALRQELDAINAEYESYFAGQSRATRDLKVLDDLLTRVRALRTKSTFVTRNAAAGSTAAALGDDLASTVQLYETEREAIAKIQSGPASTLNFARYGVMANLVFARYRRHFAGQARNTRDVGLLDELIEELTRVRAAMRVLAGTLPDPTGAANDLEAVETNLKLYQSEKGEIERSRKTGTQDEQGSTLAEVANGQFRLYTDHFAGKSRATRRPALLARMVSTLESVKKDMEALKRAGYNSDTNNNNIKIVEQNLQNYRNEMREIDKARKDTSRVDLMGNLGGAANDVFEEYRKHFAGQDRRTRDLTKLSALCDELADLNAQMLELGKAEPNEMNARNMQIVSDQRVMYENEYDAVAKAKGVIR